MLARMGQTSPAARVPSTRLAFLPSAQAALDVCSRPGRVREGNVVALVPARVGTQPARFRRRGLRVTEIAAAGDGAVDLAALARMLAQPQTRAALGT